VTYPLRAHSHIIVLRKRRIIALDVAGMTETQLEDELERAKQEADRMGEDHAGIGALTAADRDVWARARRELLAGKDGEINARGLEKVRRWHVRAYVICMLVTSAATAWPSFVKGACSRR
jgi:hypothetical protein